MDQHPPQHYSCLSQTSMFPTPLLTWSSGRSCARQQGREPPWERREHGAVFSFCMQWVTSVEAKAFSKHLTPKRGVLKPKCQINQKRFTPQKSPHSVQARICSTAITRTSGFPELQPPAPIWSSSGPQISAALLGQEVPPTSHHASRRQSIK